MILSVGLVPVKKLNGQWRFLILRCFNYWDFPKGEAEPGEKPLEVAVRELREETSLTAINFSWGESFTETEVYSKGKVARYYLGQVLEDTDPKLLPNPQTGILEHHEFRWVTFEDGLTILNARLQKVLEWANQQIKN